MSFKLFIYVFILNILFACSTTKVVRLSSAKGSSREFGSRSRFAEVANADSSQASYARSIGMDSFYVGRFNYYPSSYTVNASRVSVNNNDPQVYQERYNRIVKGTSEDIPIQNFDTEILFLFGKKRDGYYLVIADKNNNKSFSDDSAYVFHQINESINVSTKRLDSLPHITVDPVRSYYNKEVRTFSHHLIIEPVLLYEENEDRKVLHLNVASVSYMKGNFRYKKQVYQVAARNALLPYLYFDPRVVKIKFAEAADSSAFQNTNGSKLTYYVGDTVVLGKHKVAIKKVSPMLNKITIQSVRGSLSN